jgi:hypothetical protein
MTQTSAMSRRAWLKLSTAGVVGWSMSGWLEALAEQTARDPERKRSVILLWMSGGPSHMDTFDLKPGHPNGGPFKEIKTTAAEMRISEHLPRLAQQAKHLALIRSMSTKEADHGRATYLMRTGRPPGGPIQYPPLGSFLSKELDSPNAELPGFVSIAPYRFLSPAAFTAGFLGPRYAPLVVGENGGQVVAQPNGGTDYARALHVEDLDRPADVDIRRADARVALLDDMEKEFLTRRPGVASLSHHTAYQRAITMMRSQAVKAFDLEEEKDSLRDAYGRNLFGQGCLLARRLVERSVPFVEVTLSNITGGAGLGWDTHQNNFERVKRLCEVLDPAWATLMSDLKDRGLLDSTMIVWMGEFGRTPRINGNTGRDHWATSWTTVLGGGGIKGGQVIGKTTRDGMAVDGKAVSVADLLATVCQGLGIDPRKQNNSNVGRPIRLVEPSARAIQEVLS